jgi:hypothetical protein
VSKIAAFGSAYKGRVNLQELSQAAIFFALKQNKADKTMVE